MILLGAFGTFFALTYDQWSIGGSRPGATVVADDDLDIDIVALEQDAQAASSRFAAAFVDVPGDPMIIRLEGQDGSRALREMPTPDGLRDGTRIPDTLIRVSDVMVSTGKRFITTLPSTQEDFAFFRAQKSAAQASAEPSLAAVETNAVEREDASEFSDADAGWGEEVDGTTDALVFKKTRVENNTSVAFVRSERNRTRAYRDVLEQIIAKESVTAFLSTRGYPESEAKRVAEAAAAKMELENVTPGMVVAVRGTPAPDGTLRFRQMSVYSKIDGQDRYYGTLALDSSEQIQAGSDPWIEQELFDYTGDADAGASQEQRYRMMDAFYSTAIRNGVPATIVGEAIALLSRSNDLNSFANPGDRMDIIYGGERLEEDTGAGQLIYIAIRGKSVDVECFVFRDRPDGTYACYGATPRTDPGGGGGGRGAGGMVTPVKGVLTSRFGPRNHPILKTVRLHAGVDWAAPTGTPVVAAFDGVVSYAGPGGGYGNLLKITHTGGIETRYAHLHKFVASQGQRVQAGETVGLVGTTGRSTGPHLHFELRRAGKPVDPLATATTVVARSTGGASGAVEQLVSQIIKVESAGNARAKNPLSTATGLGQFIESTWIRMMKTYRPDLASSLSRRDLLELRFDPTISREMVKNLAREGESYLRARGHDITAGRLYLCHFLGAQGADLVLRSRDNQSLLEVLGAGVIKANPFLRGKDVAYIKAWAERKMSGRKRARAIAAAPTSAPAPAFVREPDGLAAFRREVKTLLGAG